MVALHNSRADILTLHALAQLAFDCAFDAEHEYRKIKKYTILVVPSEVPDDIVFQSLFNTMIHSYAALSLVRDMQHD